MPKAKLTPLDRVIKEITLPALELLRRIDQEDIPLSGGAEYRWLKAEELIDRIPARKPPIYVLPRGKKVLETKKESE